MVNARSKFCVRTPLYAVVRMYECTNVRFFLRRTELKICERGDLEVADMREDACWGLERMFEWQTLVQSFAYVRRCTTLYECTNVRMYGRIR